MSFLTKLIKSPIGRHISQPLNALRQLLRVCRLDEFLWRSLRPRGNPLQRGAGTNFISPVAECSRRSTL